MKILVGVVLGLTFYKEYLEFKYILSQYDLNLRFLKNKKSTNLTIFIRRDIFLCWWREFFKNIDRKMYLATLEIVQRCFLFTYITQNLGLDHTFGMILAKTLNFLSLLLSFCSFFLLIIFLFFEGKIS